MATYHISLNPGAKVLDFGCGCGRVIAHFAPQCAAKIDGVDIDAEAISWCDEHLGSAASFYHTPELPPLAFEDARFDLIYSVSAFTHLPEEMQMAWLAELRRVAKPGAWLLLSTHALDLISNPREDVEQITDCGLRYQRGVGTDGLPDFYRTRYHSEIYIRREWGKLFRIEVVPAGTGI